MAVQLPNITEFVVVAAAINRAGAVLVPIMPIYRGAEVEHVIQHSGASRVITVAEFGGFSFVEMYREIQRSHPQVQTIWSVRGAAAGAEVSRGYTEEIEHWAWCIRNPAPENKPKCYPEVAMADAVISLTTNVAIAKGNRGEAGYIKFEDSWFDRDSDETPDGSDVNKEMEQLNNWKIV